MEGNNNNIDEEMQNLKRCLLIGMREQMRNFGKTVRRNDLVNVCTNVMTPLVNEPVMDCSQSIGDVETHEMERIGDNNQTRQVTNKSSYEWRKKFGPKLKNFLTEGLNILMIIVFVFFGAYLLILICDQYAPNDPNRYTLPNIFKCYEYFF